MHRSSNASPSSIPSPLAAASIGQVHRGRLRDGREVAVKVQYPGIDVAIQTDLDHADWLYTMVGAFYPSLETGPVVEELRARLSEELDYAHEAREPAGVRGALPRARRGARARDRGESFDRSAC